MAVDRPPLPPAPPIGRIVIVDDEGRATAEFAQYLAKLTHYLGHLSPQTPADVKPRSKLSLADWLRANLP